MALADITIADGQSTPVNHTFAYVSSLDGKVIRSELAAPAEEPKTLTIGHREAKKSGVTTRSHMVRWDWTVLDDDNITPYIANIRMMFDIPNAVLSDGLAADLAAMVRNFCTGANIQALAKNSVL